MECKFYLYSPPAWEAMLEACKKAEISIDIEQYIFAGDTIGSQFINILKEKRSQGVKVRLLLDMVGCINFYNSSACEDLKKSGVEIRFFNTISPWRIHNFTAWFFRDHRKLLIVDGDVGFTGGLGIRDNMTHWRDTTGEVRGNVVKEMSDSFQEMWEFSEKTNLFFRIGKMRRLHKKRDFITNDPYFNKRFLYRSYIEALRVAKEKIYLTTPYFIPDRRLSRVLRLACKRGVDVRVLVPEVLDVPIVESASNATLGKLLKAGVRVFKYKPEFLHAKTAVVDGEWGTFGSYNLDSLSFLYNYEANVVTFEKRHVDTLEQHFIADTQKSGEILYSEWKKRSFVKKIKEFLAGLLRDIL